MWINAIANGMIIALYAAASYVIIAREARKTGPLSRAKVAAYGLNGAVPGILLLIVLAVVGVNAIATGVVAIFHGFAIRNWLSSFLHCQECGRSTYVINKWPIYMKKECAYCSANRSTGKVTSAKQMPGADSMSGN
ncbi:MAG: hypothetical protein K1X57_11460 [Gemmataceae bacterium]|nr:hypothetical protein [Gemmataceae bacterium]